VNTPPPEVEVQCLLGCRTLTVHRYQATVRGRPLYGCSNSCGAPLRAISEPHLKTPGVRAAAEAAHQAAVVQWKRESSRALPLEVKPFKTEAAYRAALEPIFKPTETTTMKDKLITLIRRTVSEQLGEQPKQMTDDAIRAIVQEELEKLLGDDAAAEEEPKRTLPPVTEDEPEACRHKNFMRKCESCQRRREGKE
jgi:hypothetical protein